MQETTIVHLTPKQAKQYVMMQFLDSIGVFDIKQGKVTINFDEFGIIRDVSVEHHYKPPKESYSHP